MSASIIVEGLVAALVWSLHAWVHGTRREFVVDVDVVVWIALRFGRQFHNVISRVFFSSWPDTVDILNTAAVIVFLVNCYLELVVVIVLRLSDTTGRKNSLSSF